MTSGGNNFHDFPENQLIKCRANKWSIPFGCKFHIGSSVSIKSTPLTGASTCGARALIYGRYAYA